MRSNNALRIPRGYGHAAAPLSQGLVVGHQLVNTRSGFALRPVMSGLGRARRRLRGLGEVTPYGINVDGTPVYIDDNGNVIDSSGNVMTDLSHVDSTAAGQQSATNIAVSSVQQALDTFNQALGPFSPLAPQTPHLPVAQPSTWQKFTNWLGAPIVPGAPSFLSGGLVVGGVALLAVMSSMGGRRRR